MAAQAIPDGFHTVTPYLVVDGAAQLIDFVVQGLGGREVHRLARPDGKVAHAQLAVGNSMVLLTDATAQFAPMPCSLYLYVEDVDALYKRALAAGATTLMAPAHTFYGDRCAGVLHACGVQWWLATHVEDVSEAEIARRQGTQAGQPQKN